MLVLMLANPHVQLLLINAIAAESAALSSLIGKVIHTFVDGVARCDSNQGNAGTSQ